MGAAEAKRAEQAILTAAFDLVADEHAGLHDGGHRRQGRGQQADASTAGGRPRATSFSNRSQPEPKPTSPRRITGRTHEDLRHFLDLTFEFLRATRRSKRTAQLDGRVTTGSRSPATIPEGIPGATPQRTGSARRSRRGAAGTYPPTFGGELIGDVVFGVIWYRMLATDRPLGDDDARRLTALLSSTNGPPVPP